MKEIAAGGFGVIYRAQHPRWKIVAYKELKSSAIIPERTKFVYYSHILTSFLYIHVILFATV